MEFAMAAMEAVNVVESSTAELMQIEEFSDSHFVY